MTPSRVRLVGAVFAATLALLTAIAAPRTSADEAPPASTAPATQSQAIEAELYEQIDRRKMEVEWLKQNARFG